MEGGKWKAEVGSRKSEGGSRKSESGRRKVEGGNQNAINMKWIVEELEKPYDLNLRMRQFVVAIFEFVDNLPNKPGGWAIQKQLTRSASSVGANYRAARRGRSKAEYLAKLGTVEEEADESAYWLELIISMKWDET